MSILTIYPYLTGITWVFDDSRACLKEEAFVLGALEMIHRIVKVKAISKAESGFALSFSDQPFDHDVELSWSHRTDLGEAVLGQNESDNTLAGNWYAGDVAGLNMQCWLCPALFLYFTTAPKTIYVKAERLPEGIDPIWHVDSNDVAARRFVSAEAANQPNKTPRSG